jgi:probable F420-dependent oxidoreductase
VKVGVVFPQTEIGADPRGVRAYVEAVERAGFDHIAIYDHVLGAAPRPNLNGPYDIEDQFHEVMVLFGYIAAITTRVELVTEILVLPQRQTALVAKQAAEIDLLSGGRLRLGVGLGWNWVEYEALARDFHTRGRRIEEQVDLLRRLWSEPEVTFEGADHRVVAAGLNPLPRRRIPIWLGTTADAGLRRAARIADGWQSELSLGPAAETNVRRLRGYLRDAGRDPGAFGIAAEVGPGPDGVREARGWETLGATHMSVTTMGAGLATPADHIVSLLDFKRRWDEDPAERPR